MKPTTKVTTAILAITALLIAGGVMLVVVFKNRSNPHSATTVISQQTADSLSNSTAISTTNGYVNKIDVDVAKIYAMYDAEYKALDTFSVSNYKTVYDVVDEFDRVRGFSFSKANTDSICYLKDSLLRARLVKIQIATFPILRKKHADNLDKQKWDFDINVSTNGPLNTSLILVSPAFENKANLQLVREAIQNYAFRLRFKKVSFRNKKELETYKTNSAVDDEL